MHPSNQYIEYKFTTYLNRLKSSSTLSLDDRLANAKNQSTRSYVTVLRPAGQSLPQNKDDRKPVARLTRPGKELDSLYALL